LGEDEGCGEEESGEEEMHGCSTFVGRKIVGEIAR